ncbi:unnamed protein product, partial [Durusdinium trenchii]
EIKEKVKYKKAMQLARMMLLVWGMCVGYVEMKGSETVGEISAEQLNHRNLL